MGLTRGNMVPPVLFSQCQRLTGYGNGGNGCFGAQCHIGRPALETQSAARCGAGALGENNQAAAGRNGFAGIVNQANCIAIGKETGKAQITAHKRIAEQPLLNNTIRIGYECHQKCHIQQTGMIGQNQQARALQTLHMAHFPGDDAQPANGVDKPAETSVNQGARLLLPLALIGIAPANPGASNPGNK